MSLDIHLAKKGGLSVSCNRVSCLIVIYVNIDCTKQLTGLSAVLTTATHLFIAVVVLVLDDKEQATYNVCQTHFQDLAYLHRPVG